MVKILYDTMRQKSEAMGCAFNDTPITHDHFKRDAENLEAARLRSNNDMFMLNKRKAQ